MRNTELKTSLQAELKNAIKKNKTLAEPETELSTYSATTEKTPLDRTEPKNLESDNITKEEYEENSEPAKFSNNSIWSKIFNFIKDILLFINILIHSFFTGNKYSNNSINKDYASSHASKKLQPNGNSAAPSGTNTNSIDKTNNHISRC